MGCRLGRNGRLTDSEGVPERPGRPENCTVRHHLVESLPFPVADDGVDDPTARVDLQRPIMVEDALGGSIVDGQAEIDEIPVAPSVEIGRASGRERV